MFLFIIYCGVCVCWNQHVMCSHQSIPIERVLVCLACENKQRTHPLRWVASHIRGYCGNTTHPVQNQQDCAICLYKTTESTVDIKVSCGCGGTRKVHLRCLDPTFYCAACGHVLHWHAPHVNAYRI